MPSIAHPEVAFGNSVSVHPLRRSWVYKTFGQTERETDCGQGDSTDCGQGDSTDCGQGDSTDCSQGDLTDCGQGDSTDCDQGDSYILQPLCLLGVL